ncbi:MAG: polysaccharide deacetylase family protein [Bacteroidota bacterium]
MIIVYSPVRSPRLEYVFRLILTEILGIEVTMVTDVAVFLSSPSPKLNYSGDRLGNEPFLRSGNFLFTCAIEIPELSPVVYKGETGFFPTSEDSLLPFDPFASAFLVVSRMEEYLPGKRDRHGRFEGKSSLLFHYGLIEKPVVNTWANLLAASLLDIYPGMKFFRPKFRSLTTIDIDNAWAYLNKGFARTLAAVARDLMKADFKRVKDRLLVLAGKCNDPYDTYDYLFSVLSSKGDDVIFFILTGNYSSYDKSVPWKNPSFRALIKKIAENFRVGIHPSYRSSDRQNESLVREEKERLETVSGLPVTCSRQHYLRLNLPETYRRLMAAGIEEDYSMGFHDLAGFRAGICTPFKFYDLENEQETLLTVFPFQVMDVSLCQYMKLTVEEAGKKICDLQEQVRKEGGTFVSIWHNESVTGTDLRKDYLKIFEVMNKRGEIDG